MLNYDDAIGQLTAAGLILDRTVSLDGRIQRWRVDGEDKERRGWSRLRLWRSSRGNEYVVGAYGVWHGTDAGYNKIRIEPVGDQPALDDDDRRALREADKATRKAEAAARKRETKTAARWAGAVWSHAAPTLEHEYLNRKAIKPDGTRTLISLEGLAIADLDDSNAWRLSQAVGALVVPMHDTKGQIVGLQFIYPRGHARRQKLRRDKEFWPAGMAMGGSFGVLGGVRPNGIVLIAEGFATAATLHQATGLPAVYAFSANNLVKAGKAFADAVPRARLLFCADDDYQTAGNPGTRAAAEATAAIPNSAWLAPDFVNAEGDDLRNGAKLTDFNDLAQLTGLGMPILQQVNQAIAAAGWDLISGGALAKGGGDALMPALLSVDDAVARFWGTYGLGGKVLFDEIERRLVHRDDVMNLLPPRSWDLVKTHPDWRVARDDQIGFDPTEQDSTVKCNLFAGWPSVPQAGDCDQLLGLLEYLCSNEQHNKVALFEWVQKWLAYPLQHPGAKMHSAIVVHGPQGTGKSRFFEAYGEIFGPYATILGQEALEDKFNADWAEKKLFIIADEVLARQEMYHVKNRLKGFITGKSVRVNPKNVAAHTEKNQMNLVFLSNEHMPLVLEQDDRRHCVIYVPPQLPEDYFESVNAEIDAGGVAALHDYLLHLDLGDFKPWTKPPDTGAKQDLVALGQSSAERFLREWRALELLGADGQVLPFGPCQGSTLYRVYARWCEQYGERRRPAKELIGLLGKQPGWSAGVSYKTAITLTQTDQSTYKNRKLVVPSTVDIEQAYQQAAPDDRAARLPRADETKTRWLTRCFFAFEQSVDDSL